MSFREDFRECAIEWLVQESGLPRPVVVKRRLYKLNAKKSLEERKMKFFYEFLKRKWKQ